MDGNWSYYGDYFIMCKNIESLCPSHEINISSVQFSHSVMSESWTSAYQASLSITNSWSVPKLLSIGLVTPPNHLILCRPLPLLSSIFPIINQGPFQSISTSHQVSIGTSASASALPMNIQDWFPLGLTSLISLQFKALSGVFSNTIVQKHQFFSTQPSLWSNSNIHTWQLEKP